MSDLPELQAEWTKLTARWAIKPVDFVCRALGVQPDAWQCDVLDTFVTTSRVAVRAGEQQGLTTLGAWAALHTLYTSDMSQVRLIAANPDVLAALWASVVRWQRSTLDTAPWLATQFTDQGTAFVHRAHAALYALRTLVDPLELDALPNATLILDEAQGVDPAIWERIRRRGDDLRVLTLSKPSRRDERWPHTFVIHPAALRETLKRDEAAAYSTSGTYYSTRNDRLVSSLPECPAYTARVIGDLPDDDERYVLPYALLADGDTRYDGLPGDTWVAVAVSHVPRTGREAIADAPVSLMVARGGTVLHIEPSTADHTDRRKTIQRLEKEADALRQRFKARGVLSNDPRFVVSYRHDHHAADAYAIDLDALRDPRNPTRAASVKEMAKHYTDLRSKLAYDVRDLLHDGHVSVGRLPNALRTPLLVALSQVIVTTDPAARKHVQPPDGEPGTVVDALCLLATRLISQATSEIARLPVPREQHRFVEHVKYWDALEAKLRQRTPIERALRWYRDTYPGEYVPSDQALHRWLRAKPESWYVRTLRKQPAGEPRVPYLNVIEEQAEALEQLKDRLVRMHAAEEANGQESPELRQTYALYFEALSKHHQMLQQYGLAPMASPTQRVRIDERSEQRIYHHAYAHLDEADAKHLHLLEEKVDRGEIEVMDLYRVAGEVFTREQEAARRALHAAPGSERD